MRTMRSVIIPAILALGAAGSILAGSAAPAVVAQAPASHVLTATSSAIPTVYYHT